MNRAGPRCTALALTLTLALAACGPSDEDGSASVREAMAAQLTPPEGIRRVWARSADYATPSPDGRFVTFVDWSTGDVAMRNLKTGENILLTDKGDWFENDSWPEEPLFSPDGEHVAFAYGNTRYAGEHESGWRYELQMVRVGEKTQRMIFALEPDDLWLGPFDWSATHGIVAEVNRANRTVEFSLIDPATGSAQVLEVIPKGEDHPHEAFFSPDDRYLADRRGKRIHLRDLTSGNSAVLAIPVSRLLGWAPNSGALLVHTARDAEMGIWAVPLNGLEESGEPLLVHAGLPGVLPSGRAGDRMFYVLIVDTPKLYRTAIDPVEGGVLAEPRALTSMVDGRASHPTWSPDGASLAYVVGSPLEQHSRVMLMATDGDAVRELRQVDFHQNAIRRLGWTDDGRFLVFVAIKDGDQALYRIDAETGELTLRGRSDWGGRDFDLAGDGASVIWARGAAQFDGDVAVLVHSSMVDGSERVITSLPGGRGVSGVHLSPDGSQVAIQYRDYERGDATGVMLVSLDDGSIRDLYEVSPPQRVEPNHRMGWTPDGRHVIAALGSFDDDDGPSEVISISVETGEATTITRAFGQARYFRMHPDGRRFSFVGGEHREELWVIDDVPAAIAAARAD